MNCFINYLHLADFDTMYELHDAFTVMKKRRQKSIERTRKRKVENVFLCCACFSEGSSLNLLLHFPFLSFPILHIS
ncbi:hypothetical protein VNO80_17281 [Phaseolus coccineus]|uniref:Uncharacterized protein n=1 Tax=Phaseolus coccineus TaxID=3886 RepID=A0AAN9MUU2_PHACN